MEISSTSSQAMALRENMSQIQMGTAAIKQAADAQNKLSEMLAQRAQEVPPPESAEPGRFDTYA